jgi:hypothetical protein
MTASIEALIARHNEVLHQRIAALTTTRSAGELCAIEITSSDDDDRFRRWSLVREALSQGLNPKDLGLAFVVAVAECAYELDWGDRFSFWPQISEALGAPKWDPRNLDLREQCTFAFRTFSNEYKGLRPQGRFADCYTHVSWPLFHAMLPRAAQPRMSKLLARAAADPRFVVAADGTIDERDLSGLLREFAKRSSMPAYFEGVLQHPTFGGRLGVSLLSTARTTTGESAGGLSDEFMARVLRDLRKDRVASEQLEEATEEVVRKEERAQRRQRAIEASLEPPRPTLVLERSNGNVRMFVEVGPLDPAARDWRPLATAISSGEARIALRINDVLVPAGYLVNMAYGAVSIAAPWPSGSESLDLSIVVHSSAGRPVDEEVVAYFDRSKRTLRLPLVLLRDPDGRRFSLAPSELRPGADVAIVAPARLIRSLEALSSSLGMEIISFSQRAEPLAVAGELPPISSTEFQEYARRLGLRRGKDSAEIRPVIAPPIRSASDAAEWLEGDDAFVQIAATVIAADLRLTHEMSGESRALQIIAAPNGALIARVPREDGTLVIRSVETELARLRVSRRPRPAYRESPARFRVVVMPSRPTRAQLLGEACWLDVEALPGVHLRIELVGGGCSEEESLPADSATPLRTALLIASMRRRIEETLGPKAALADYELRVSNADEPMLPATVEHFAAVDAVVGFAVTDDHAVVRLNVDADAASLWSFTFGPGGVAEHAEPAAECLDLGALEGVRLARAGGAIAALAWASRRTGVPRMSALDLPKRGAERGLTVVGLLRACEAASLGPARYVGRALMLRRVAVRSMERELVASMCGHRWLELEERCQIASGAGLLDDLRENLRPLLWVPRVWLQDELPRLVDEADPVEALERACQEGIGDALTAGDARWARHLFFLFTRASMASIEDDGECTRWANADVMRPRLVRLFYLAYPMGLARLVEASDVSAPAAEAT